MHYEVKSSYMLLLFLIDCFGTIFFFWTKFFRVPLNPKKILVIRFDHAGDMLVTSPVFRAIKKTFPNSELSVLCRPFVKDLVITNKFVDKVHVLDVPWFKRETSVSWLDAFKFLLNLRKNRFDLVLELHGDPRNIFAAFITGGFRVGFGARGFGFLLNKTADFSANKQIVDKILDVIRVAGIKCNSRDDFSLNLFLTKDDEKSAQDSLKKNKIKQFILLHPCSGRTEKNWFVNSWAELCDELIKKYKLPIIITGYGDERIISQNIIAKLAQNSKKFVLDFCGQCDGLRILGALCKKSALIISTDTVVVHIAQAINKKNVTLYGSTDPLIWGYNTQNTAQIYKKLSDSCSSDCRKEIHRMNMMKEISVTDVLSAVDKLKLKFF